MTEYDYEIYDNYTPNKNVQSRLNKVDTNPDMISHQDILAVLEYEGALSEDSAMTKTEIKQIIENIEEDTIARNIPTARTIKNRLDELAKNEIVVKEKSSRPYEYWKKEEDKVEHLYYWYVDALVRKIDPYVRKVTYPHTISALAIVIYIVITLPLILESADVLLLLLLIGFYLIGHLAAYFGEMMVN